MADTQLYVVPVNDHNPFISTKESSTSPISPSCTLGDQAASDSDGTTLENISEVDIHGSMSHEVLLDLKEAVPGLNDQMVRAPFNYVRKLPSKGVRSKVIYALNDWYTVPEEKLQIIIQVIDSLHNASLMLDDIEDNSPLRRGYPSTHQIFNQGLTINSANFVVAVAAGLVHKQLGPKCLDIFLEELGHLYIGQSWDLYWTSHANCPSVAEYICAIDYKTGGLFRMACGMMSAESKAANVPTTDALVNLLGRFFQIRDDYQNLVSPDYNNKKGFCEDLDEGKFSLPMIHCLNDNQPSWLILAGLLQERVVNKKMSFEAKKLVLEQLEGTQSLKYTWQVLDGIFSEILTKLVEVEQEVGQRNSKLREVLDKLSVS